MSRFKTEAEKKLISLKPKNFRDVYWCNYINEPVIMEYRSAIRTESGKLILSKEPSAKNQFPYCTCCDNFVERPGKKDMLSGGISHNFMFHIIKPF